VNVPDGYIPAFGVPYARAVIQGRKEFKECPRCGALIRSVALKDFESRSGIEYAEHYEAEHAIADGRILVDGVWYEKR
jgi:uncharacterized C2H2 Zn-finger protein